MSVPRYCLTAGCPELVRQGTRCPRHARTAERRYDARRGSAVERGYDATWRRIRNRKLRRDPLCERCLRNGRTTPGELVHHVLPLADGGTHAPTNLMTACNTCHGQIHAEIDHHPQRSNTK